MRTRPFWLAGLLVALLLAGVASYYASADPDGLESAAEQVGILDEAEDSATAGGPLADYSTRGVDDARLSGGLAGVLGVLVTLALAGGVALVVRRRGDTGDTGDTGHAADEPTVPDDDPTTTGRR